MLQTMDVTADVDIRMVLGIELLLGIEASVNTNNRIYREIPDLFKLAKSFLSAENIAWNAK